MEGNSTHYRHTLPGSFTNQFLSSEIPSYGTGSRTQIYAKYNDAFVCHGNQVVKLPGYLVGRADLIFSALFFGIT
jgi:hypothetical protein